MTTTDRRGRTVDGTDSSALPADPNPGLAIKQACLVATTANITLTGLQSIDGVTVAENDRVLVKDQTTGSENGIYNASSGNWTRSVDWDGTHEIASGTHVIVVTGTLNALKGYTVTTADPLVIGTTSLTIAELANADVTAIGALTTGIIAKTGTAAYSGRTITGTANEITATNGSGVSGNPTLSLPSALTFTGKEVTGGTFTSIVAKGTWTVSGTWTVPAMTWAGTVSGGGQQLNNVIIGTSTPLAVTGTVITGNSFVPNLSTVPSNGMYLPAANTLGWAINSVAELQLTATAFSPVASDGNALGTSSLRWGDLFGATGFVVDINADWIATHTAGILTVGTGDLRVTTPGTNSASVLTYGGAWTAYTPTVTSQGNTITAYTATGRYKQIGKTIIMEADVTLTTVGTATLGMIVTLPLTAAGFHYTGLGSEIVTSGKSGRAYIAASGTNLDSRDSTGTSWFAGGNGTRVIIGVTYEIP